MRKTVLILVLAVMLAPAVALADHESVEDFYSHGGTRVSSCFDVGCPSETFTFGNVTGVVWWQVAEKVFYNATTNQTDFTYTVFNDAWTVPPPMSLTDPLTSFGVYNMGFVPVNSTASERWVYIENAYSFDWATTGLAPSYCLYWVTADPTSGIYQHSSLDNMIVSLRGNVPVTFDYAFAGFSGGYGGYDLHPSGDYQWKAGAPAPVPEPGTLALLGTGLIGIAGVIRRKLTWS